MEKVKLKSSKAITLIALIITIVVLIILASVGIILSLGNNGIINKASQGRNNYQISANQEKEDITGMEEQIDSIIETRR